MLESLSSTEPKQSFAWAFEDIVNKIKNIAYFIEYLA
jgi:hypothetical protein